MGGIAWDHERHRRGKVPPPDTRINRRQMAANCGDVFGGGTVSYDPGTHTLTLTNYTYSGEGAICDDSMYACIVYKRIPWTSEPLEPLTLKLVGSNALTYS